MPAHTPEDLDVLFASAINFGDIEAVMKLYEPTACLTPEPGEVVSGTTAKWVLEGTGPDGKPMRMEGQSAEVARRQPDGTWRFAIDNPHGLR